MPSASASAAGRDGALVARVLALPPLRPAANDDERGFAPGHGGRPALLRAALRHFAAHGVAAGELARANAARAFFADRLHEYHHWLAICRTLDRRLATGARRPATGARHPDRG